MNRTSRRFLLLASLLGLSLLSCGREVTGPADGLWFGRNPTAALSLDPRFPELPGGNFASDLVPFVRVRITIRNLADTVVKDTTVDFPSNVDSIALTLTVPLPSTTAADGVPLSLVMAFVNAAGDTVFRGGPSAIVARPRGASGASQPIEIPVSWVPPGAVPTSVVLTPTNGSVVSGTTTVFRATAFSSVGDSIPNTPIVFTVDTAARVTLVTVGSTSTATWQPTAGNVRVIASTLNLRADTSFFVVSLPVSTQLAITAAPTTAVAGTTLSAITVAVRDASNVLTSLFTGPVTLTLNAGATGATLAGTATVNAVAGVATFSGLSIQRAATGLTLTASSGALTPATSAALTITPAAPTALVTLAGDAQSGTLGQPLTDSVDVQLRDAFANPIVGSSIAFSITSGGGSISPASVVTNANGRARARWTLGTAVGAQTARAQLAGVPAVFAALGATGAPGAPVRLEISTEPAATQVAGAAIAPSIAVRVVDAVGATVTSFTGTVGLALAANPGATTPTGVLATAAVAGVASFANVAVPIAATGYTLAATSGALTPDTTIAFTVLSAAASQMTLVSGGGQSATVGGALASPLVVRITDAFGNGVPGFAVNWTVTTGAGTLAAASSATNATGFASNTLTLSNTAGGVVVSATASGITGSPQQFTATALAGAVTQLAYTLNTGGGTAGVPITPGWVIQARDAQANLVSGFNGPVTVVLSNGPGGATLGGTTTVNAVGGIATFANLTVDRIASSWVLIASSPGLSNASSAAFFITPAAAAAIAVQAGNAQTAAVLAQVAGQITFRVSDAFGNPTNGTALTVTVTSGGGSAGTASGVTNVSGELSTTWTLGNTLGAQSLTATVTLTPALQAVATATATPGAATTLVITTGPIGPQVAGVPFQDVVVEARDAVGNRATSFNGTVRALVGGTLADSTFATAVGGVVTFTGAFLEAAGTFFVRFSAPGLTEAVSDTFAVAPAAATQMVLSSGNGQNGIAGQLLPLPVVVRIEDPFLNRVPGVTVSWVMFRGVDTLALNTNVSDANGLATWRPTLPTSVTAVQIIARSTGLTNSPITVTENVTGDVTTQLTMFTQPVGGAAGATLPASAVRARDQYGNFKVAFTGNVTAAIDSGPAGAVLSGTTTVAAVGGTATFSTLAVDVAGTYRLRYSSVGLTNAVSTAFVITPSAADQLTVTTPAAGATNGAAFTTQPVIAVRDAVGNLIATDNSTVVNMVVSLGGTVVGTATATAVNGVATFATVGIAGVTATYTLTFNATGLNAATQTGLVLAAGAASQLVITTAAAGATSGAAFTTQPVVAVRDAAGNPVSTSTALVTMSVSARATVIGAANDTSRATGGVATFSLIGLSGPVGPYTLTFTSGGLTLATQPITIAAPAAQVLSWTGTVSTNWGTAGNWNLNRLPLSTDSVVINGGATVNIASADTVRWLTVAETGSPTLTIASGATLTVDSLAVFGGTSTVTMTGGTLTGGGSIIVSGIMNWSGGTMAGTGSTLISTVGTLAVTGAPTLNNRSLFIGGTATLGGTAFNAVNTPDVGVLAGGTLSFTSTTSYFSGNGLVDLINAGTLRKAGSAGLVRVDWPITNTGTIEVVDDSLDLRNTLSHAGGTVSILANAALVNGGNTVASAPITIAAGGVMTLQSGGISADAGNHIFGPTSSVSGLGRLRINSADTTRIQGTLNIDSLTVQNGNTWFESADTMFVTRGAYLGGGFFRGSGVLGIRGDFVLNAGNIVGGGTMSVRPAGTLTLRGMSGWSVDVAGTAVWGDYQMSLGQDTLNGNGFSSMRIRSGGTLDIQHAGVDQEWFGTGAVAPPNNIITVDAGGVIRKSTGTAISNIRPRVLHSGQFDVQAGTINIQGSCAVTGGTKVGSGLLTGNFSPTGGCVIP